MGWRSWNAWGNRVSQTNMEASMDALVAKLWTVDNKPNVSLFEAGYTTAGIDEGWEGCGKGVHGTQHDAQGNPVINQKFPDMSGLVKKGHGLGLKVGWCVPVHDGHGCSRAADPRSVGTRTAARVASARRSPSTTRVMCASSTPSASTE